MGRRRKRIESGQIADFFDQLEPTVFRTMDIEKILTKNRDKWGVPKSTSQRDSLERLLEGTKLQKVEMKFPSRKETRYTWGSVSVYDLAMSMARNVYFCHYTAMMLHNLTEQVSRTVYVNREQPPKPRIDSELVQSRIDAAFRKRPRVSKNIAVCGKHQICLLSGKQTGNFGVVPIETAEGGRALVTNLERTLIDIIVRPFYSGGVSEVLKAFKQARESVSINKLVATLQKLDHIYPYHQALGFCLEKAGFNEKTISSFLDKFEIKYDFYLDRQLREKSYSKRWRLFYPKGL